MNDLTKLKTMVGALLANGTDLPTQGKIRDLIEELRQACPDVSDKQAEQLALEFEEMHGVRMTDGASLQAPGFVPWLPDARPGIDFYYYDRYRDLLARKGFSREVLGGIGNVTDRIVGLLEDPRKPGSWDRRGMVMGHVQSGKTANYIGVVTKAADAGYRVIVIMAGLQNKLRNQTQERVDEGFIGFARTAGKKESLSSRRLGVGLSDYRRRPNSFTTSNRDFHKRIAESLMVPLQNLKEPAVFVIKKNTSTLRNLIDWLKTQNAQLGTEKIEEPMLLVDDEADNASINIKKHQDDVSRINGQIREFLNLFSKSCYVGYTATPFSNLFIDPDTAHDMKGADLFPRDFIVSLDPPSNYFGPTRVFIEEPETILQDIDDHSDLLPTSHRIDHLVIGLPESLWDAIRTFVLARALRVLRGQDRAHNSMLVNVSRFVLVQRQVRNLIQSFIEQIGSHIRVNGGKRPAEALRDPEIANLHRVFELHYENACEFGWSDVQAVLHHSVSPVVIVEVNNKSAGSLDYSEHEAKGLNVIAVGGFSLSRGLTLEGLTVSYFLRRSLMYDTLFQMGRWFGYRGGYEDLCRVWMPEEAQGWYEHIAESIEELREEMARMQSANATPMEFGLKVRSHPDMLIVTARNKMGSGQEHTVLIGLASSFVETAVLRREKPILAANLRAVESLADSMRLRGLAPESGRKTAFGRLVRDVPVDMVDRFLGSFQNHKGCPKTESDPVRRYISERAQDELSNWDVLFAGVSRESAQSLVDERLGFRIVCQRRAAGKARSDNRTLVVTSKQRVSSRGITKVGLTESQIRDAERKFDASRAHVSRGGGTNYPDRIYTSERTRPLLIVHLLAIGEKGEDLSGATPVAAWSISFPTTRLEEKKVEYVVNTTWFREHFGEDDTDDDETATEEE